MDEKDLHTGVRRVRTGMLSQMERACAKVLREGNARMKYQCGVSVVEDRVMRTTVGDGRTG